MKFLFFVALLIAGTYGQLTADQQLLLQQQQFFTNPALSSVQLQQQLLYPGLGLQGFNPYLNPFLVNNPVNNPFLYIALNPLTKSPYTPILGPNLPVQPAIQEVIKEVDFVRPTPTGLSGVVELDGIDAYIQDSKNKGVGHTETYHWSRSGLPKGRSSLDFNRYVQQQALLNSGKVPNWWSNGFNKNERFKAPFTVNNPPHTEVYTYN